jgi:hypothetical protein
MKAQKYFMCAVMWRPGVGATFAQNVTISVNATQNKRLILPYIYGKNEDFDRQKVSPTVSALIRLFVCPNMNLKGT